MYEERAINEHNSRKKNANKKERNIFYTRPSSSSSSHSVLGFVESEESMRSSSILFIPLLFGVFLNLLRKCMWPVIAFYVLVFASSPYHGFLFSSQRESFFFRCSFSRLKKKEKKICGLSVGIALALKFIWNEFLSVFNDDDDDDYIIICGVFGATTIIMCDRSMPRYVIYRQEFCVFFFFFEFSAHFYSFFVSIIIMRSIGHTTFAKLTPPKRWWVTTCVASWVYGERATR